MIAVLPVSKEGALQPASQFIEFEQGSHHITERQASDHPHSVTFSPDGRYLLAADLGADKSGAGLAFSPDGHFLYMSNRGEKNQIIVFRVDPHSGKLSDGKHCRSGGIEPRAFSFDARGRNLFVANTYSNNVVEFSRDLNTEAITPTGATLHIGTPTHIRFVKGLN